MNSGANLKFDFANVSFEENKDNELDTIKLIKGYCSMEQAVKNERLNELKEKEKLIDSEIELLEKEKAFKQIELECVRISDEITKKSMEMQNYVKNLREKNIINVWHEFVKTQKKIGIIENGAYLFRVQMSKKANGLFHVYYELTINPKLKKIEIEGRKHKIPVKVGERDFINEADADKYYKVCKIMFGKYFTEEIPPVVKKINSVIKSDRDMEIDINGFDIISLYGVTIFGYRVEE